jgi:hypothetical protein
VTGQHQLAVAHSLLEARRDDFTGMKGKADYGREPDYAVLPTKIVCQSNRPAQVKTSRQADLFGTGQPALGRVSKVG